jgi:hypothetical protein
MSVKTAGVGHFTIPTAPAAGTSVTSGAANVFTTTYVQLIASTAASLYITGIYVEKAAASAATYCVIQLATGAAAAETIVGQHLIALSTGSTVALGYKPIFPPIPVANATRISCKSADSVGAQAALVTLECIAQASVVDDAIPVTTVTTVTGQLTAAQIATGVWQDATAGDFTTASSIGRSLYTTGATPGAAGGLFIAGSNAGTTVNFTGNLSGSVGSVTAAVLLPTIPANWITAAGITAAALNGKGDWNIGKTGYALSAAGVQSIWDALTSTMTTVGSIGKKLADWSIGTAQTGDAYARLGAPAGASVSADLAAVKADTAAVKTKTDQLAFTVAGQVDGNIKSVAGTTVTGSGTAGSPWGP